ncbi:MULTISPECIES: nicotinate (nicotinamide) nucleotide adenylyltransferase [unclassified Ruminococcus]|uniref:nicotinate (nicotinamide) nucleotide adenylyltransferase n=1 Tax=unclassified Ruminococcus TaxID=2608920 RepID=UPI00210977BB|nr:MULTISPECIES: nicotinate (nicotinamide) nucleotide adenylyltransferase [unclassified Ruminococcus]MCQ4021638.1 nicotinate (nicotinamide) nucleotide adenylyltransferase [Ruminococcus sp. zg-924]MCQ4114083.1 nicotinate (nicotinamide) nucleotide adenylyltransferase [Ruminococcus sp. zg-921]
MKKIAMFGGSFNPPHIGHLQLAQAYIEALELDTLLLVPVFSPPHKSANGMVTAEHRLNMCALLEKYNNKIKVSDIEIKRGGSSYTVDTLKALKTLYKGSELYLIIGADMYMSLQSWYQPEQICALAKICTISRNSDDVLMLENHSRFLKRFGCESVILKGRVMTVSSTQVRSAVKSGESILSLVVPEVYDYIKRNGLYI